MVFGSLATTGPKDPLLGLNMPQKLQTNNKIIDTQTQQFEQNAEKRTALKSEHYLLTKAMKALPTQPHGQIVFFFPSRCLTVLLVP